MDGWFKGQGLSALCTAGSCAERHRLYVIVDSLRTACSAARGLTVLHIHVHTLAICHIRIKIFRSSYHLPFHRVTYLLPVPDKGDITPVDFKCAPLTWQGKTNYSE